jgi:hypothetical protein
MTAFSLVGKGTAVAEKSSIHCPVSSTAEHPLYILPNPNKINNFNLRGHINLHIILVVVESQKLDKSWLTHIMISLLCTNFKSRTWDALPTLVS